MLGSFPAQSEVAMSLKPTAIPPVPELTSQVARAAFPKGNPYLTLREALGTIFSDEDFTELYPERGQPSLSPWQLALVTVLQFRENLPDRQAAEAVRARIDWKFFLGLELTDPGFDFSVLSEFRDRLRLGGAEAILLDKLLGRCRELGLVKARGKQRTDATRVLAAIRVLNRLELVGETLRAALNALATEAPVWLQSVAPQEWYGRYGRRIEDDRLPEKQAERDAYARTIGEDGYYLLHLLSLADAPIGLRELPAVQTLHQVWQRHFQRKPDDQTGRDEVQLTPKQELGPAGEAIESPYDTQARFRSRYTTSWTGYMVHLSESCDDETPHLITHVHTTQATVHEAQCTETIQQELVAKDLPPAEQFVDSAYIDAELLVQSQTKRGITLIGPTRANNTWQTKTEGAYTADQFVVDWEKQQVRCPQGKIAPSWTERIDHTGMPYIAVVFSERDCKSCPARALCTRKAKGARRLKLQPQAQYLALQQARQRHASEEGRLLYNRRAGIEGTISQGVRAFELRQTRYRGLAKAHLQHIAIAAAINLDRIVAWLEEIPRALTRTSRFAALKPA
jgi:transposase